MNPLTKFWSLAKSQPDSLALVSTSVQMNYRDLGENIARFAGVLKREGVQKGSVVAIRLQPELEAVVILAATQIGAVTLSASKIILENYRDYIDFLVCEDPLQHFKENQRILVNAELMATLGGVAKINEPTLLNDDALVRLSFSSGTTGVPKGIPFSAGELPLRTESAHRNWRQATPGMSLLGLDTITGIIALFWAVTFGSTYFVSKSAKDNLELIKRYGIKALETSPARLKDLVNAAGGAQSTSLTQILVAGSLMTGSIDEACQSTFGVKTQYLYGSTEVGAATVGWFDAQQNNRLGKLVTDVEFEIVDDESKSVDSETTGNIRYRKPWMAKEYWHSPSRKLNGFWDGWFYPGDRGFLSSDGYLYLEGRNDDVVNAAGSKFNLLTLDLWLAQTNFFDEVASFTFLRDGQTQIGLAFVATNPPEPALLVEKVQNFLPNLQVSEFLRLSALPRNKMDKVDRKALTSMIEEQNA